MKKDTPSKVSFTYTPYGAEGSRTLSGLPADEIRYDIDHSSEMSSLEYFFVTFHNFMWILLIRYLPH